VDVSGWTATEWTGAALVVLTLALVIITGIYAYLTARVARSSEKSAHAAEAAARSAQLAAEASRLESALTEAALSVDFEAALEVEYDGDPETQEPITVVEHLEVTCTGATVFVHNVSVEAFILREDNDFEVIMSPRRLEPVLGDVELPLLRHRGESLALSWEGPTPRRGDKTRWGRIAVDYSITRDGPKRTITRDVRMPSGDKGLP
jgi:hypothetical protein